MGIYNEERSSIGNSVWYDDNRNGMQDRLEYGVDSVKVTLYTADNVEVDTTLTDTRGNYKFINLLPGDYYLAFSELPVSYEVTDPNMGKDTKDSDVSPTTFRTEVITLEEGQNDLSWDMGIYNEKRAAIGHTVWYDDNANGIQDAHEIGAEDILVKLYQDNGNLAQSTITDVRGNYSFRELIPGSYYVEFIHLPVGYEISPQDMGTDDRIDSDVNPSTGRTVSTELDIAEYDMNWDMGIFNREKAVLGDMVWYDNNHNGLQDMNEIGVNGVKVTLYDANKNMIDTLVTDEKGKYLFRELDEGDYFVEFTEFPVGYMITKQNVTDDYLHDSDANYHRGQTIVTHLDEGENDLSWDLGLYVPTLVNFGDRIWDDVNHNGIQDRDEAGLKNVKVTLVKNGVLQIPSEQTTTPTTSVYTDENGHYLFENIEAFEPHQYHIVLDNRTLPEDYIISPLNSGDNQEVDSNMNPETELTRDVVLEDKDNLSQDVGIIQFRTTDDVVIANETGAVTTIDVLGNDNGNIQTGTLLFVDIKDGSVLNSDGTAVAGTTLNTSETYVVEGEGTWSVVDGKITFTAEDGFEGIPTPVYYLVQGESGHNSNVSRVVISTPCTCKTYDSSVNDSVPTLNYWSMLLVLFLVSTLGLFFARREFE